MDLEAVTSALVAREPIFHKPEFGTTRQDYAAQIVDDFWEVGASGRVYDRAVVLDTLVTRGKVAGDEHWIVSDVACRPIEGEAYALTYRLDENGRLSRRLTIWKRIGGDWKALYPQGTLIQEA